MTDAQAQHTMTTQDALDAHTERSAVMVDRMYGTAVATRCGDIAAQLAERVLPDEQWTHVITVLRTHGFAIDAIDASTCTAEELATHVRRVPFTLTSAGTHTLTKDRALDWWSSMLVLLDLAGFRITRKGC